MTPAQEKPYELHEYWGWVYHYTGDDGIIYMRKAEYISDSTSWHSRIGIMPDGTIKTQEATP